MEKTKLCLGIYEEGVWKLEPGDAGKLSAQ